MAGELVYTSSERGLKPRSRGFCTVAMTYGMPANLAERLENLSGYRACFPPSDPSAARNPVNYSFCRFSLGGINYPVLSRVSAYGSDYSGRSNKLAHHLVLDEADLHVAGPVWLCRQAGLFRTEWSGEPQLIHESRPIPSAPRPPGVAATWSSVAGDAGWAGAMAEHTLAKADNIVALLFTPELGSDTLLALLDEATALLPPQQRWQTTFSTYLTDMPTGTTCRWRCMLPDSPEWEKIRRNKSVLLLDLTKGPLGQATGSALVAAARDGTNPYL